MGGGALRPGEGVGISGNTLLYTCWDGTTWSSPVDILLVPGENLAEFPAVDVDAENQLHVAWMATTRLYYSNALSWAAGSAHSWSEPTVLADYGAMGQFGVDIAADPLGGVHVVYAANVGDAGIYYLRSADGGLTWQEPISLSEPFGPSESWFSVVRIVGDHSGRLHAVWQTNQSEGYGQAIYYARSTDHGDTWNSPVQLGRRDPGDYEVAWPYLAAVGESELHLIHVDGPGSVGRFHRISTDGGETWSTPYHILDEMVGVNGNTVPIVDGAGQMHLIVNMRRRDTQRTGIYYARRLGNGWSPVEPVDISGPGAPSAHYAAAALRRGNELHVVYTQHKGGEIWGIRGTTLSVDQTPVLPVPSPEVSMPQSGASGTPRLTQTPQPKPRTQLPYDTEPASAPGSAAYPLVFGLASATLVVAGGVVWARTRAQ